MVKFQIIVFKKIRTTSELGLQQAKRIQKELMKEYGEEYRIIMKPIEAENKK
jgi:hypothetical protein